MKDKIINTLIFAVIMLIVDLTWLKTYMKKAYTNLFSKLNLRLNTNLVGDAIAYIVMIASYPLLIYNKNDNLKQTLLKAASVGFIIFGTYGFTLNAIMPQYNVKLALTETVWGIFLFSFVSLATYFIKDKLQRE